MSAEDWNSSALTTQTWIGTMSIINKLSTGASRETAPMSITHVQAEALGKALYRKRGMNKADPKAIARFNRAALELAGGVAWAYDPQTEVLTMGSTTTAGVTYRVTFISCTCKAGAKGLTCVHCGAYDLLYSALWSGPEADRVAE